MRMRAGITQVQLAEKLRINKAYLSQLEAGKRGWISQDRLDQLVKEYCALQPKDMEPILEVLPQLAKGAKPKPLVEEVFLVDGDLYRTARGDLTILELADRLKLSSSTVGRFERCQLRELTDAKVALLAVYYATLARELLR